MERDNPRSWQWPSDRPPDADGIWEITCLKDLAIAIQERDRDITLVIDVDDVTCIHFSVIRSDKKTGEAYVNRAAANSDVPLFSIFYGCEEAELHSRSVEECASRLAAADGFPGEPR